MKSLSTEFKVGVFTILAVGLFVYFVLRTDDRENSFFEKPTLVNAVVDSVDGVQSGTSVEIAGVSIGSVHEVKLSETGKAMVVMSIQPRYKLPKDTKLAMKTRGLLGDRFIMLSPGVSDEMIVNGGSIEIIDKGLDMDALSARAETISADVEKITAGLKSLVGSEENKAAIERIIANLDVVGEKLPGMAVSTQRDLDGVVKDISVLTKQMQQLISNTNEIIAKTGVGVDKQMVVLTELSQKLDMAVGDVSNITAKIERGEGTVGRLLNDTELIERINGTVTDVQDLVGTVGRMKSTVGYRGEFFVSGSPEYQLGSRNALQISLMPREDYGYLIELVSDPAGSVSEEQISYYGTWYDGTTTSPTQPASFTELRRVDDFLYTLQFQRRWDNLGLRFGVKYSTGGIGADYFALDDRLTLHADVFDFSAGKLPNLKLQAHLNLLQMLYLGVGVDDALNGVDGWVRQTDSLRGTPWGPAFFIGGGFTFEDDDIKLLLTALPISP